MSAERSLEQLFQSVEFLAFDFDGVFTDNRVFTDQEGHEMIACWRSDGLGLDRVKNLGVPICVISSETNPVVTQRCKKLHIPCFQGTNDKVGVLRELLTQHNCKPEQAIFVGNDINDEACLRFVGLPIVVADAYPEVIDLATYVTQRPGGRGAVREVCDLLFTHNSNKQLDNNSSDTL